MAAEEKVRSIAAELDFYEPVGREEAIQSLMEAVGDEVGVTLNPEPEEVIIKRALVKRFLSEAPKLGMVVEKVTRKDGDDEIVIYTGWDYNEESERYEPMKGVD